MYIFPLALLLTNYRCHDSILRLPSNLFFNSTLQVRTNSELHPKTSSALHFVCTSMKSMIVSTEDCSMEEARITLEQVCSISLKYIFLFTSLFFGRYNVMLILGQKLNGEIEIYRAFVLWHPVQVR